MRRFWRGFVVSIVVLFGLPLALPLRPVWAAEKKDDKAVLDEVLDILKDKGQITEEKYQELKARAKKEGAGKILAGIEGVRPFLKSADGQHKLELTGRLNFDVRAYEEGSRNLDSNRSNVSAARSDLTTNFRVRRARLGVEGTFFKYLGIKVEADFGEGSAVLVDGWAELNYWPEARLRAGQFKVPFSYEQLASTRFLEFVERSVMNNLVPAYDLGAMLHGTLFGGVVDYGVGIFNGRGQNAAETNDSKDLAGRLLVRPLKLLNLRDLGELHLAGHVTHGDQDVTPAPSPASANSLQGQTDGRFVFFPRIPTRGDRLRYGLEAVYAYGPFGLYGEYVKTEEERNLGPHGANLGDLEAQGWYVVGSVFLTGEEKVHNKAPKLKRNFNPRTGDFGAVEVAGRFAQLDFNSDGALPSPGANRVDALTIGVNWYLSSNVRLMFNWVQNWFDNNNMTPIKGENTSWEILSRLALWF